MYLLAIDPGSVKSAYVVLYQDGRVVQAEIAPNVLLATRLQEWSERLFDPTRLAIEFPRARGQLASNDLFLTCFWVGRFVQAWTQLEGMYQFVVRQDVVHHLLGRNPKGADAAIRQYLIDRYGPTKAQAIGTKKQPGPLYGLTGDAWQALAVGLYALETGEEKSMAG